MLVNMREILDDAKAGGYGIPCINTPNMDTLRALINAAEELDTPVIIDHAEVHNSLIPIEREGRLMVEMAKKAKVPVCVHLDHGVSYSFLMKALEAGFSSIMFDRSQFPFEENVAAVKEFVEFAHARDITVEGELGKMCSTAEDTHDGDAESRVLTNEDIREFFTEPDEAAEFAERTKVDALAVVFGTMHGIYSEPPVLDIDRVKEIRKVVRPETHIVMHGASGVDLDQIRTAIQAGCSKVNYYSYIGKGAANYCKDVVNAKNGAIQYHELCEYAYEYIKGYAKDVLSEFRTDRPRQEYNVLNKTFEEIYNK